MSSGFNEPRVFVSFTARDPLGPAVARLLLTRLDKQPVSPWIFESVSERVPAGARITPYCKREIERADVFIPVITDQFVASEYAAMEVEHASELETLMLLPILLTGSGVWRPPFDRLMDVKHLARWDGPFPLTPESDKISGLVEGCVHGICARLGVEYVPPEEDAPRLPLRRRLLAELGALNSQSECATQDVGKYLDLADRIARASTDQREREALNYAETLATLLRLEFGDHQFYYPNIVLGVLHAAMAGGDARSLRAARQHFSALVSADHPLLDANAYAGMGYVDLLLGDAELSLGNYLTAEARLDSRDPAAWHNVMLASLLAGHPLQAEQLRQRIDELKKGLAVKRPGDVRRLWLLYALGLLCADLPDEATEILAEIDDIPASDWDLVVNLVDQMRGVAERTGTRGPLVSARELIQRVLHDFSAVSEPVHGVLMQREAIVSHDLGDLTHYKAVLAHLTRIFPTSAQFLMDEAVAFSEVGDSILAAERCHRVLGMVSGEESNPPVEPKLFLYLCGLAHWLLSNDALAADYLARSGEDQIGYDEHFPVLARSRA